MCKVNEKYEKEIIVNPSRTDFSGKLGVSSCFDLFMDIANEHADKLGCGLSSFSEKGLFWLTAKSRIRFYRRPSICETVMLSTWPETASGTKCIRNYQLKKGSEILAEGKTLWAVLDINSKRPIDIRKVYPDVWELKDDSFHPGEFSEIHIDETQKFAEYRINSGDIDLGRHMNNVAYIRALLKTKTTEELKTFSPSEIEIHYKSPCYEGDLLEFSKSVDDSGLYIKGSVGDRTAVLMKILP